MKSAPKRPFDIYQEVTDRILAEIDAGTPPWRKPWTGSTVGLTMPFRATGEAYRGINVLMLWLAASAAGYTSPTWMTYRQAQALGGQVRKGERSALVVKFGTFEREGEDPTTGDLDTVTRVYARAYNVFNVDQIDGLDARFYVRPEPARDLGTVSDPILAAWFGRMGVPISESDEAAAYYVPAEDRIHMPRIGTFENAGAFYGTLAHEMAHSTKHPTRLDRRHEGRTREDNYAREEVVAELAACMTCARLGIAPAFDQSAAYLEHWAGVMREDKRAIVRAATMAQAATDWMFVAAGEVGEHGLREAA